MFCDNKKVRMQFPINTSIQINLVSLFIFYSETELLQKDNNNISFYNSFAVVAADYISNNASHCKFLIFCGYVFDNFFKKFIIRCSNN